MTAYYSSAHELDNVLKRFQSSTSLDNKKQRPKSPTTLAFDAGTTRYVNNIVCKPMSDTDLVQKLDWYNKMTDRTVTCSKVRGNQSQECFKCGYNEWCRGLEMNFICFDKSGMYLKWCCDCMAKEMGGKFMPSPELKQARAESTTKKMQELENAAPPPPQVKITVQQQQEPTSATSTKTTTPTVDLSARIQQRRQARRRVKISIMSPPLCLDKESRTNSFSTTTTAPSSTGSTQDARSTSVASPTFSTTSSLESTCTGSTRNPPTISRFLCTFCSVVLQELRTTFSDDYETAGFHCQTCQNEFYCLECAHEMGGDFCHDCGAFQCRNCKSNEEEEDYFYCSKACACRGENRKSGRDTHDYNEGSDRYFDLM